MYFFGVPSFCSSKFFATAGLIGHWGRVPKIFELFILNLLPLAFYMSALKGRGETAKAALILQAAFAPLLAGLYTFNKICCLWVSANSL